jgi:predicted small lipoprotein YifL
MRDTMTRPALWLVAVLIAVVLAGTVLSACGQKGPLYLPSQKKTKVPGTPQQQPPDAPPQATPPPQTTTAAPS